MNAHQLALFETQTPKHKPNLHEVLACLNSIPYINAGGCGISALAIYRWCKDHDIAVSDRPFVVLMDDEWDAQANDSYLNSGDVLTAWYPHIAISIGGELVDSRGVDNPAVNSYDGRCEYQLSEDELIEALNGKSSWNTLFSRKRHISKIEYALGIDLSDIALHPGE